MPQTGWRDTANGREEPFQYWLTQAEKDGEALGFPFEVLQGMARQLDKSDRPDGISVTMLLGCARAVYLEGTEEFFAEAASNYAAYRGTIGHAMLEASPHPAAIVERRFFRLYRGEPISGQLDKFMVEDADGTPRKDLAEQWAEYLDALYVWEQAIRIFGSDPSAEDLPKAAPQPPQTPFDPSTVTFLVEDWKTKDKVPFGIYVYDHHKQQGNLYRWLLRIPGDRVRIRFIYVSMTEVKGLHVYNGGKFANGRERPMQVWSDEETEEFLDNRMRILALQRKKGRPLPYAKVPVDDLWQCAYCPVRDLCYTRAGDEALAAFQKGEAPGRITPRDPDAEKKVSLPKKRKAKKEEAA